MHLPVLIGSTPDHAYWPSPGNGTAQINGNASTFYYTHKDWLGSARINSVIVNPYVVSDQAYAPFGEVYNKVIANIGVPAQMFTGDPQDTLGGVFDTPNRELNASQGRWLSPDPAGLAAVDPTNPQTWNRYAYVADNPLSFVDPLGLQVDGPGQCSTGSGDPCASGGGGPGGGGPGGNDTTYYFEGFPISAGTFQLLMTLGNGKTSFSGSTSNLGIVINTYAITPYGNSTYDGMYAVLAQTRKNSGTSMISKSQEETEVSLHWEETVLEAWIQRLS